jgi:protein Tob/BTG
MHTEISAAIDLLVRLLRLSTAPQLPVFLSTLTALLCERYKDHWHPTLHSGYRAITCFPGRLDPILVKALAASHMDVVSVQRCIMHTELIVWIDPAEVAYRVGERGLVVSIYKERSQAQSLQVQLEGYAYSSPSSSSRSSSSSASSSPDVSPTTVKSTWYDVSPANHGWNSWRHMMMQSNQQFMQRNVKGVARNLTRPVYVAA